MIGAVIFVDDIMGIGDRETVIKIMKSCVQMEQKKKWEFSTEKSNWMVMKTGKKNEVVEDIEINVKRGRITREIIYKYLGNWICCICRRDVIAVRLYTRILILVRYSVNAHVRRYNMAHASTN